MNNAGDNRERVKLTRKNFSEQMFLYGYFSEQLPPCFTSHDFAVHWEDVCAIAKKKSSHASAPVDLSTFKSGFSRRVVSVPNPWDFAATVKFMGEHWAEVKKFAASPHSQSPIFFISNYLMEEAETINSECARESLHARSDYVANLRERIVASLGYKYRLSVDVATFYSSIYTHSIAWAICGKESCKRYISLQGTPEGASLKPKNYDFADQLDALIRSQKRKETSGILTGPFTSRIFSEILMAGVDRMLKERNKEFVFKRYVDDYAFYFKTEADLRNGIIEIERVLNEFSLSLNQQKVVVEEYPFDSMSPLKSRLNAAYGEGGTFGLLNEAGIMHSSGEKGAYKYALKMLENNGIEPGDEEVVLAALFNINLVNPKYSKYIVGFINRNKEALGIARLGEIIAEELHRSLEERLEQEMLNYLFFIKELCLPYKKLLLSKVLDKGDDFSRIIALDLWVNHKDWALGKNPYETKVLNESVARLANEMRGASMDGEHWLLVYESRLHGLLEGMSLANGGTSKLFIKMEELGISFYR